MRGDPSSTGVGAGVSPRARGESSAHGAAVHSLCGVRPRDVIEVRRPPVAADANRRLLAAPPERLERERLVGKVRSRELLDARPHARRRTGDGRQRRRRNGAGVVGNDGFPAEERRGPAAVDVEQEEQLRLGVALQPQRHGGAEAQRRHVRTSGTGVAAAVQVVARNCQRGTPASQHACRPDDARRPDGAWWRLEGRGPFQKRDQVTRPGVARRRRVWRRHEVRGAHRLVGGVDAKVRMLKRVRRRRPRRPGEPGVLDRTLVVRVRGAGDVGAAAVGLEEREESQRIGCAPEKVGVEEEHGKRAASLRGV
mmetsp:Transcript_9610/g.33181  ORF Transcript_9610/g.33181 Transcript_9610/m.33181 type:complete len:310 (-) Transcript_9610:132-1061(-)